MNKKIICFVGIGIASLCAWIGALLLFQNIEKRSGDELCRIGLRHMETGDDVEAVKYWRKAADKGDVLALRLLAKCYENGNRGVEQDLTKAAELYCKAASRRNGDGEWYYEDTKYWLYETQFSFIATYPYDDPYDDVDIYTTDFCCR